MTSAPGKDLGKMIIAAALPAIRIEGCLGVRKTMWTCNTLALLGAFFLIQGFAAGAPKRLELGFPQLSKRVQVVLPENYSPERKWPAVFYYHGTGGQPTTSFMQAHTRSRDWIVVGMTYTQEGRLPATAEYLEKEFTILASTRRHLAAKWNLDPRRCYVGGFSKGGWMAGFLLQYDPTLAGGIILGAGHQFLIREPTRFRQPKSLFVGVGRMDENYPFALRSVVHYRSLGARVMMKEWNGLGHALPEGGSRALTQWMGLEAHPEDDYKQEVRGWLVERLDQIQGLPDLVDQWTAIRDLERMPFFRMAGADDKARVAVLRSALERGVRVGAEAKALTAHQVLLRREAKGHSLSGCQRLATEYLALSENHAGTRQADIALGDHERMKKLILHLRTQRKIEAELKAKGEAGKDGVPGIDPFKGEREERRPIPDNPLLRR